MGYNADISIFKKIRFQIYQSLLDPISRYCLAPAYHARLRKRSPYVLNPVRSRRAHFASLARRKSGSPEGEVYNFGGSGSRFFARFSNQQLYRRNSVPEFNQTLHFEWGNSPPSLDTLVIAPYLDTQRWQLSSAHDFREFKVGSRSFLIGNVMSIDQKRIRPLLMDFDEQTQQITRTLVLNESNLPSGAELQATEKNWAAFVLPSDKCFYLKPSLGHSWILKIDADSLKIEHLPCAPTSLPIRDLRSPSPPLAIQWQGQPFFLGLAHTRKFPLRLWDFLLLAPLYRSYFFLAESQPPFRVTEIRGPVQFDISLQGFAYPFQLSQVSSEFLRLTMTESDRSVLSMELRLAEILQLFFKQRKSP